MKPDKELLRVFHLKENSYLDHLNYELLTCSERARIFDLLVLDAKIESSSDANQKFIQGLKMEVCA